MTTTRQQTDADNAEAALKTADNSTGPLLLQQQLTGRVLGCFFEVHWRLGYGFVEGVYAHALAVEFERRGIAAHREVPLTVLYRGVEVGNFRADFVVGDAVLLEVKTAERLTRAHECQTVNYLHATGIEVALLLNFGPRPTFRRLVASTSKRR